MAPMSEPLGARLPPEILARLAAPDAGHLMGRAIQIATLDPEGRPHPALLSYGEVVATDPCTLRIATYAASRTSDNLRRRGALTLCLVEPGSVHYVKARARELPGGAPGHPGLARFEAAVEDVLVDHPDPGREADAVIVAGVTFHARDEAAKRREWAELRAALREPA